MGKERYFLLQVFYIERYILLKTVVVFSWLFFCESEQGSKKYWFKTFNLTGFFLTIFEEKKILIFFLLFEYSSKQVTRGHNIVADGLAGASNPNSNPNSQPTHKHTQKVSKTLIFSISTRSLQTDRRTKGPRDQCNGPTDQRTDKASYTLFFL